MEFLDDVLRWDTNGGDEEFCTGVNNNLGEFVKFSLCIIVAVQSIVSLLFFAETCFTCD